MKITNKSTIIEQTIYNTESQPHACNLNLTLLLTCVSLQSSPSQKPMCQHVLSGVFRNSLWRWVLLAKTWTNINEWIEQCFNTNHISHISGIHTLQYQYSAVYVTMYGLAPDTTVPAQSRHRFNTCINIYSLNTFAWPTISHILRLFWKYKSKRIVSDSQH